MFLTNEYENLRVDTVAHEGLVFDVLHLGGHLVEQRAEEIGPALRTLATCGTGRVVLDGSRMSYASSTGFALLLELRSKLRERGGELKLANLSPAVARSIRLLGLSAHFDVFPTREAAYFSYHRADARTRAAQRIAA